ncbi:MAG: DUF1189 family protein [Verrucomicrobiae bacterium]|nr:DUF1189 family protein [Verrucomicrobiae bacterium]
MNYLRMFWAACGGFRSYRLFLGLSNWTALGFWSLFGLACSIAIIITLLHQSEHVFPEIQRAAKTIPHLRIEQGRAVSNLPLPYYANTNSFPIIIDLKNTVTEPHKLFARGILIHEQDLLLWLNHQPLLNMKLKGYPEGDINPAYFENLRKALRQGAPLLVFLGWLFITTSGVIQAIFFSGLTCFLERAMKPRFSFSQLFRIATFSLTPSTLIVTVYFCLDITELDLRVIFLGVYCFFLVMATSACRNGLPPPSEDGKA